MANESVTVIEMVNEFLGVPVKEQKDSSKYKRAVWSLPVGSVCSGAHVECMLTASGYDDVTVEYETRTRECRLKLTIPLYYTSDEVETLFGGA